jgi:hypothetical protein
VKEEAVEIMIPVWLTPEVAQIAPKGLGSLRGAKVALVDDNFDEPFTGHLEKLLREQHGAVVDRLIKPLGSAPSPRSLIDRAAQSEVAIVGIAL